MNDTPTRFAAVAATLVANGYRPVPIAPGRKDPRFKSWEKFAYKPGCEDKFDGYGAGVLLGELVGVDIDVDDPDAAAAIENAVREIAGLGDAAEIPRRIGKAPRVLLPFRTGKPFRKCVTAQYRLRLVPDAKPAKVEVLASGQQFVAYHVHPDTHQPYTWNGAGDLLSTPVARLPELTEAQAHEIIKAAEGLLAEWGERIGEQHDDEINREGAPGATIAEGGRNDALTQEAGRLRRMGYSAETILAALQQINAERCDPPLPEAEVRAIAESIGRYAPGSAAGNAATAKQTNAQSSTWPAPLDMAALATTPPHRPRFILADWLPCGYATLFAGHGGVGKSALALHLAVCIAFGIAFFGVPTERRRVLYLACEDREGLLHWRLTHICACLGVDMAELAGHLDVLDLVGHDAVLWDRDPRTGFTVTSAYNELATRMERTLPKVLFVDGVSDTFGGNENARTEVKRYVNALLALVPPADGALLLLGHVAKPAASNTATSEGYSGSTQWHNAVRARWYLYPETEAGEDDDRRQRTGKLELELQKSNLGPINHAMTFKWDDQAHLFIKVGGANTSAGRGLVESIERRSAEHAIVAFVAKAQANSDPVHAGLKSHRNLHARMKAADALPASFAGRSGPKQLFATVERLRAQDKIGVKTILDSWRKPREFLTTNADDVAKGSAK